MSRAILVVAAGIVLLIVGVLVYRHYGPSREEARQAEAGPAANAPKAPFAWDEAPPPPAPPAPDTARPAAGAPAPSVPGQPQARAPMLPVPTAGQRSHVVQSGESLWTISRKYYGTPKYIERLADANSLEAPNRLRIGQVLVIPDFKGTARPAAPAAPSHPASDGAHGRPPPDVPAAPSADAGHTRPAPEPVEEPMPATLHKATVDEF